MYDNMRKQPVFVSKELRSAGAGVYLIYFASGQFYIGASTMLQRRIQTHICFVRGGGKVKTGCKALQQITDFEGGASFYLLEEIKGAPDRWKEWAMVLKAEKLHKLKYQSSPKLLNHITRLA